MSRRSRRSKRKLNSLFMMLLLTGMLLLSSTYAWFSASRDVELNGINAKVVAAEGLQISLDGESWSSKITINQTTLGAATSNKYQWPTALTPVSTNGATTSGNLNLFYGNVINDGADLSAVSAETDPAVGTAGGKYIVFDLYFKNASSQTSDELQMNVGSKVEIPSEGVTNTGLENCVRAGLVLWENSTIMSDSGENVRKIAAGTTKTFIWEPNYLSHIAEVTKNDSRVASETSSSPFKTFGIVKGGDLLSGVNGTAKNDFMNIQNTYTTAGGTIDTAVTMTDMTPSSTDGSATGGSLTLKGNSVMKARVYIWLEGQDPDCIDTASTGKSIDIVLGFTKPAVNKGT